MLYGTLEYDGRAQRLLEVLGALGHVLVVDVATHAETDGLAAWRRRAIRMPARAGKVRRHLRFWRTVLFETMRHRPKVIVSANFFATFPAWIASRLMGLQLIYDAYELIIPESGRSMSWRDRFWYGVERLTVRRTDLIIAANEDRARLMQTHYGLARTPAVMRNIPPRRKTIDGRQTILARYPELARRNAEERLVLYQGDVSLSRGIDRFIWALAYLGLEYRMIVVGGGPDLEHLRVIGQPFERENRFVTLGRVEHRLLPAISAMADVGIVTYPFQGLNNIYCAPNKLFEYAQAGLPIVATDQPPLRRLVETYGIGRLVSEHESPEQLATVIHDVAENKAGYAEALASFLEDHQWEDEAERVRAAVVSIVSNSRCTV